MSSAATKLEGLYRMKKVLREVLSIKGKHCQEKKFCELKKLRNMRN